MAESIKARFSLEEWGLDFALHLSFVVDNHKAPSHSPNRIINRCRHLRIPIEPETSEDNSDSNSNCSLVGSRNIDHLRHCRWCTQHCSDYSRSIIDYDFGWLSFAIFLNN